MNFPNRRLGDTVRPIAPAADLADDPRLLEAVQEYLNQLETGHRPDRGQFLRRYPGLGEALGQCLDGLDLVHEAAGEEKSPAEHPVGARLGDALPANPLGDFRILREIGRGGMGVVYEAVQLSLGRRVALKVLPFAATFDAKHLQRFRNEAQAAAQLHHTNIVPVYAVGCERGVHFYAMQLIDGQSLAALIRQMRRQAGHRAEDDELANGGRKPPEFHEESGGLLRPLAKNVEQLTTSYPPSMPPLEAPPAPETVSQWSLALSTQRSDKRDEFFRTAARLVHQAAEALEYAHQFGIVHRDIKPANLLVDVHGRLWITDFGLAQFHADAGLTQTGDILGTLRYMSPEQASGQRLLLDHRTDVYSLGATLYELATLEPIFPGQNRQQLLHQIINEEPRAPRSLEKTVPVELETIILKAVAKTPSDRYSSAHELAEDLRRYLEDKPILAKRPSLTERARKWSRRHPEMVSAGVLLLLVIIAGLLVNNRMIADEKAKTTQRAVEAEARFQQARQVVDLLVQVCEEELADAPPHLQGVRKRLLEMALRYYQDFIEQQQGNTGVQAELEGGKNRLRRILDDLSTLQGAHQLFLMMDSAFWKDSNLSDAQRDQIVKLGARWSEQRLTYFSNQRQLTPEVSRQEFLKLAKEHEDALAEILDAEQLQRLRQIALQSQGTLAFHEPRVVDALRLTTAQKQKIREIENSMFAAMWPRQPEKGGPIDHRKRMEEGVRNARERILAILTPEQAAQWRNLTGEPFKGATSFAPPGPFGPR